MSAKRKWTWLLLLFPLGLGLKILYLAWVDPPDPPAPPSTVFKDAGYLTLRMTVDYHAPGSLYAVDEITEDGFVNLRPACNIDRGELERVKEIRRTTDVSVAIAQKLSAGAEVAQENWSRLGFESDLSNTREIRSVFTDSSVELLSTESILRLRDSYLERAACFAAVKTELERGYDVCQTEAVIVSDLVYRVKEGTGGKIGATGVLDRILRFLTFGSFERVVEKTVEGGKMYHAVKLHRPRQGTSCILLNRSTAQAGENQGR